MGRPGGKVHDMKPVLLLIPGMFNTAEVWQSVAALLNDHAEVRIADVLTQDSIAGMAADAWRLLADVPAGTPRIVAGFSMGGYVAIELLASHGASIDAVAFVDTSAQVETAESLQARHRAIAALKLNFALTVEATLLFSLHPDNHTNAKLVDARRRMMHAVGEETAIRQIHAISARANHRVMLSQLRIPVLVACGVEDQVTPPALSQDLADLIPGARLEWIEGAGHQTPVEQPQALAQSLMWLIAQADARSLAAAANVSRPPAPRLPAQT